LFPCGGDVGGVFPKPIAEAVKLAPPPEPPEPPAVLSRQDPLPPPVEVIVLKIESFPFVFVDVCGIVPAGLPFPPPPTVIG
jgi:hypothetical protein